MKTNGLCHAAMSVANAQLARNGIPDMSAVQFVADHDRGLITHRAGLLKFPRLLAQFTQAWPELNITIAVARTNDAHTLADALRDRHVTCEAFTSKRRPNVETRVAICTYLHLADNPIEPEKQDIVFCLDALEATGVQPRYCLEFLHSAAPHRRCRS
jgi:hypothetical protein